MKFSTLPFLILSVLWGACVTARLEMSVGYATSGQSQLCMCNPMAPGGASSDPNANCFRVANTSGRQVITGLVAEGPCNIRGCDWRFGGDPTGNYSCMTKSPKICP